MEGGGALSALSQNKIDDVELIIGEFPAFFLLNFFFFLFLVYLFLQFSFLNLGYA